MTIPRAFRGQLEYVVILVLATVLVLAVLMVLGTQVHPV
jgi:Flp pilus assembly pilin Flp